MLKKFIIPHKENDYTPHFFRNTCIIFIVIIMLSTLSLSLVGNAMLKEKDLLSAIYASVLVDLTNKDRNSDSLPLLKINPTLEYVAEMKAADMVEKSYFAHTSPEGLSPWYWFDKAGYKFIYAGENLAVNFGESDAVEKAWMASPGHRANILNNNFSEIGIAVKDGVFQGRKTIFVVQTFGKPAIIAYLPKPKEPIIYDTKTSPTKELLKLAEREVAPYEVKGANMEVLEDSKNENGNSIFIAVKNSETGGDIEIVSDANTPATKTTESSFFAKWAMKFPKIVETGYIGLFILTVIALILLILVEIKIQRPKSIALGLLLLMFISLSLYLNSQSDLYQLAYML